MNVALAMERWERIPDAKKIDVVSRGVTRWAARYLDSLLSSMLRILARKEIQRAVEEGAGVEALLRDADAGAKRFSALVAAQPEQTAAFLRDRVTDLSGRLETDVIEALIDSRKFDTLRGLLQHALRFEAVNLLRLETYGDRAEKLYREELDAHKGL
jgi:hypothetical protein